MRLPCVFGMRRRQCNQFLSQLLLDAVQLIIKHGIHVDGLLVNHATNWLQQDTQQTVQFSCQATSFVDHAIFWLPDFVYSWLLIVFLKIKYDDDDDDDAKASTPTQIH